MSGVARKIYRPEVRRGMEKFKRDKIVAVIVTDESSHAANCVLVGLKVGNNELLESDDVVRERNKAARRTDIRSDGRFGEGACAEWP